MDESYLSHHGILGMKWGIRRYQNPDGSLTDAGRKRYINSDDTLTKHGEKAYKKANRKIDHELYNIDFDQEYLRDLMNSYWYEDAKTRKVNDQLFKDSYTDLMNDFNRLHKIETFIHDLGKTPLKDISSKTEFYGRFYNDPRNPYRK